MRVLVVPVLSDNYSYILVDEATKQAAVVDPVSPSKVLAALKETGAELRGIITTHHHADHAGGNKELLSLMKDHDLTVWGGDDRIPGLTHPVQNGEVFSLGRLKIKALETKCHTQGSVSFYVVDPETQEKAVFTGDTMFIAGCGRFFEGDAHQMHHSLIEVLGTLPGDTKVYCGHEYTKSNLRFAQSLDPSYAPVLQKLQWCEDHPQSVPSTIADELSFNPFMRLGDPAIRRKVGVPDNGGRDVSVEVMARLRALKDQFRG
ncbi:beta-lactamase-like protein [Phlyctochytrium arcticum]|nr:beta-lactamase-like protein [Phlyctochytrium arcticum]